MDLGALLREARDARGLTQRQVARRADVTVQALSRWERGDRPVRSDVADRVLAACGSDVRMTLVDRHHDVDQTLTELAGQSVHERMSQLRRLLSVTHLDALQATGVTVFAGAWAAAAWGMPPLHQIGRILVASAPSDLAAVSAALAPQMPLRMTPSGPWGAIWDAEALVRQPHAQWNSVLLGDFVIEVVDELGPEQRVATDALPWRLVVPERLVPQDVDPETLARWQSLGAT